MDSLAVILVRDHFSDVKRRNVVVEKRDVISLRMCYCYVRRDMRACPNNDEW